MKGFNLSMQFTGVGDVSRYNLERRELVTTGFYGNNRLTDVFDAWSESNRNSTIPRIIANDPAQNNRFSSRFIESGAYLRLNYMELGYTLPNPQQIGMSRARIYVGASNLFTATEYTGLDPESYDSPTPVHPAEAYLQTGNTGAALQQVNDIRTRARMSTSDGTEAAVPANLTAVTLEDIANERFVELAGEMGIRWTDLRRWHAAGYLDLGTWGVEEFGYPHAPSSFAFEVPKHLLYPIPQSEIETNQIIAQSGNNPGY